MEAQSSSSLSEGLLQKLIGAKLAGTKLPNGGYSFRSNEEAARVAMSVFWETAKDWCVSGHIFKDDA